MTAGVVPAADAGVEAFAERLAAIGQRRVLLPQLRALLRAVDPAVVGTVAERERLAAIIDALDVRGLISTPRTPERWNHDGSPPVPSFVIVDQAERPAGRRRRARGAASYPWRPELAFARGLLLTEEEFADLRRIQEFLRDVDEDGIVHVRERSYQIFRDEKRLDTMRGRRLFRSDRLNLPLLRCRLHHAPFPVVRVGTGHTMLISENDNPFASLIEASTVHGGSCLGWVGYGAGASVQTAIDSVMDDGREVERILYWGDLDTAGLEIGARTARRAAVEGLPPVEPASYLYSWMLSRPSSTTKPVPWERVRREASWLPMTLQADVINLLANGRRVPQEAITLCDLRADDSWLRALGAPPLGVATARLTDISPSWADTSSETPISDHDAE